MTEHNSKSTAVHNELRKEVAALDKLRRKRSAAIRAVAEANAAFDAQWKIWNTPDFVARFDHEHASGVLLGNAAALEEAEYDLAIELNNLFYIDQEDDYGSIDIIKRTEAEWAAREKTAKGKVA